MKLVQIEKKGGAWSVVVYGDDGDTASRFRSAIDVQRWLDTQLFCEGDMLDIAPCSSLFRIPWSGYTVEVVPATAEYRTVHLVGGLSYLDEAVLTVAMERSQRLSVYDAAGNRIVLFAAAGNVIQVSGVAANWRQFIEQIAHENFPGAECGWVSGVPSTYPYWVHLPKPVRVWYRHEVAMMQPADGTLRPCEFVPLPECSNLSVCMSVR